MQIYNYKYSHFLVNKLHILVKVSPLCFVNTCWEPKYQEMFTIDLFHFPSSNLKL